MMRWTATTVWPVAVWHGLSISVVWVVCDDDDEGGTGEIERNRKGKNYNELFLGHY